MRTLIGSALLIGLAACGDEPSSPSVIVSPTPRPAAVTVLSGSDQVGKAGEALPQPLGLRVLDARGNGLPAVEVIWRVASGGGQLSPDEGTGRSNITLTRSGPDGSTEVIFLPTRLGLSTVVAKVAGLRDSLVFRANANGLVIHNAYWGFFLAPNDSTDTTVPTGTPVEWVTYWGEVEIESISAPPGGEWFSVTLRPGERHRLVPEVAGTWEWTYRYPGEPVQTGGRLHSVPVDP